MQLKDEIKELRETRNEIGKINPGSEEYREITEKLSEKQKEMEVEDYRENRSKVDELINKYPKIFQDYEGNPGRVNWDCPPGWIDIVDELCSKIQKHCDETGLQTRCAQVKEKFGSLRFYVDSADETVDNLIDEAEDKSLNTCLECGSTEDVKTKGHGWVVTLCHKCRNTGDTLVIVDMINDFCHPEGALYIEGVEDIIPRIQELRKKYDTVLYVCDAHAQDDDEFKNWPVHAVDGTWGADIVDKLEPGFGDVSYSKQSFDATDNIRFFEDIMDAEKVTVVGVATEYCVTATALSISQAGIDCNVNPEAVLHAGLDSSELTENLVKLGLNNVTAERR